MTTTGGQHAHGPRDLVGAPRDWPPSGDVRPVDRIEEEHMAEQDTERKMVRVEDPHHAGRFINMDEATAKERGLTVAGPTATAKAREAQPERAPATDTRDATARTDSNGGGIVGSASTKKRRTAGGDKGEQ